MPVSMAALAVGKKIASLPRDQHGPDQASRRSCIRGEAVSTRPRG
jgi:hypothetical protein